MHSGMKDRYVHSSKYLLYELYQRSSLSLTSLADGDFCLGFCDETDMALFVQPCSLPRPAQINTDTCRRRVEGGGNKNGSMKHGSTTASVWGMSLGHLFGLQNREH